MTEHRLNDLLTPLFLNEYISNELRSIFIDFVFHGRPRRDIDGANGMNSCNRLLQIPVDSRKFHGLWGDAIAAAQNGNTYLSTRWEVGCFRRSENGKLESAPFASDDLFHARYLRRCPADCASLPNCEGLLIQRESMNTQFLGGCKLRESRIAISVSSMMGSKPASFSTVTLRDHKSEEHHDMRSPRAREDARILMRANNCGGFPCVAEFQVETHVLLQDWQQEWNSTLGHIERIV
ncbi:hypothetical protein P170DRAFT_427314 [Aspergillus steynii IBT 23096]|uniref:Uncharacterized protein n=1 Tax=Aspergillus steynii IBT 23096 TaxID=1392250 RepID=A0A2I2G5Q3_9EURO|nr:uncharacterized protein P170DRAFT_427314 [Aspergillus steynii IBT 23096]PLB48205.1 hypothetical protein P170DRAFT_427314 [Aspergillus steynii IBT 23096]